MASCSQFDEPNARVFACQLGIPRIIGCDLHCIACGADASLPGVTGHRTAGRRWLRPHPGKWVGDNYYPQESRDGRGNYFFLRSGDPRTVGPTGVTHWLRGGSWGSTYAQLANCWVQCLGTPCLHDMPTIIEEYFDHQGDLSDPWTICDCDAGDNDCEAGYGYCCWCGLLATCAVFSGGEWPPRGMYCTRNDDDPASVWLNHDYLYNAAVATTGAGEDRYGTNVCSHNRAVECWGHRDPGSGCAAWDFDSDDYYNDKYSAFDYLYVKRLGPSDLEPQSGAWFKGDTPLAKLRNAVLKWFETDRAAGYGDDNNGLVHFDQLDSPRRTASLAQNMNSELLKFDRSWDGPPDMPFEQLPVMAQLTGKLRKTGYTFQADYVLVSAVMRVSIIMYGLDTLDFNVAATSEIVNQTYPLIRIELLINLGIRADLSGFPQQRVKHWRKAGEQGAPETIDLENHYVNTLSEMDNFPVVLPEGRDEICYEFEGEPVRPDAQFSWRGHLGFLSRPQTYDVYYHVSSIGYDCCRLWWGFNGASFGGAEQPPGTYVPALASHIDAQWDEDETLDETHLVYGGGMTLLINTSNTPCY